MTLAELASWLRCPRCRLPLDIDGALTLACDAGHRFDGNKRGYLNALDPRHGIHGDTAEILDARARFLEWGHYRPIADALAARMPQRSPGAPIQVVDSGCGTGYYLARVLEAAPGTQGLALDASAAAVTSAVRLTGAPGLVADVWRDLPVRDARADVVTCVFAPRNAGEFARMLRAHGRLVVVTPDPTHLAQLRDAGRLIGMQEDKLAHLDETLAQHFTLDDRESLSYTVRLDGAAQRSIMAMGPTGHHDRSGASGDTTDTDMDVTVAVDVSVFTRR